LKDHGLNLIFLALALKSIFAVFNLIGIFWICHTLQSASNLIIFCYFIHRIFNLPTKPIFVVNLAYFAGQYSDLCLKVV